MITRQEMFNRAWNGLKAQGWVQCFDSDSMTCVYFDKETGRRCAWGHVDPENTEDRLGGVGALHESNTGVAAGLSGEDLGFAKRLQGTHDYHHDGVSMEDAMRALASQYGLSIPDEVTP